MNHKAQSIHSFFIENLPVPELSRNIVIGLLAGLALTVGALAIYLKPITQAASIIPQAENELVILTNNARLKEGKLPLEWNSKLHEAAYSKASHMLEVGYFDHISPDGTTPWSFIKDSGYFYSTAGENLAMDFNVSAHAVDAWMQSPTHRANILDNDFTELGLAIREGVLNGEKTTIIVQMFGTPSSALDLIGENLIPTSSLLEN